LRAAWLGTTDLEQQKRTCVDLQKQLWEDVPLIPMGEYWQATAYRKDLIDVLPRCLRHSMALERPLGAARWGYYTTSDLYRAIREGKPRPVRAVIGFGANMLLAHAAGARGREAR
jgi:hypothetical protein